MADTAIPLLATKLFVPEERPSLVARPRLVERLQDTLHHSLALVSAPAGFGKTTVVTQWIAVHRPPGGVAWVSLDEGDNDPVRFWDYFVAAVRTLIPEVGGTALTMLHSPDSYATEAVLTALINDLAPISNDLVVVLDDYHLITAEAVHIGVAFLIDHLPPRTHLVIATRTDPSLPLTRFRGRDKMLEVRTDDLRFTLEEATGLLQKMLGPALSSTEVKALNEHTEGWAVGLKMAAVSLRGQMDIAAFIESFTGSQRYVMDYLVEEVLKLQPDEVRDFLLKTSVLEKLTAPLCDFITGRKSGQDMLVRLEQSNLFVVPLDASRQWYRYHHLFAELLRHQLKVASGDGEMNRLHVQASQWYEDNKLPDDAIHHALTAEAWERAVMLIRAVADQRVKLGENLTLLGWLQKVPEKTVRTDLDLYRQYSRVLVETGRFEAAERALGYLENDGHADDSLLGEVALEQAEIARRLGNVQRTTELARRALSLLPPDSLALRGRASLTLGVNLYVTGLLDEAWPVLGDASELSQQAQDYVVFSQAASYLAFLLHHRGKLRESSEMSRRAIDLSGQSLAAGFAGFFLGWVQYEQSDLEGAAYHLERAAALGELRGQRDTLVSFYTLLSRIRLAQRDTAAALNAMAKADRLLDEGRIRPGIRAFSIIYHGLQAIRLDDLAAVSKWSSWLGEHSNTVDFAFRHLPARLLIALDKKTAAAGQLDNYYKEATRANAQALVIQTRVYQALAAANQTEALSFLVEALEMGQTEGFIRTFVDEGRLLKPLLEKAWSQGVTPDYTRKLLDIIDTEESMRQARDGVVAPHASQGLLSERELEIVRLVASGLSNRQIADRLIITSGTAKRHVHNIFEKLDARDRLQAVNRARELHLI